MTTSDHPASHYLRIYRIRLGMVDDGTARPSARGVEFMKQLVAALSTLDPSDAVRLQTTEQVARFTNATTGEFLAEVTLVDHV